MSTLGSLDAVVDEVLAAWHPPSRVVIGIVGAPGAGKSTVAELLVRRLGPHAVLLPMDGFHLPQARLRELGRRDRMGAPDTFDVDGFAALLERVRRDSGDLSAPGFDRTIEEATPGTVVIPAEARIVVVEGNYLLLDTDGWGQVGRMIDLVFCVEVEPGIRHSRLVARHEQFGKSTADALAWARGPDEANARLIERSAARADHRVRLP